MTKEEVEKLWMDNPESMQFLKNATKFYNLTYCATSNKLYENL